MSHRSETDSPTGPAQPAKRLATKRPGPNRTLYHKQQLLTVQWCWVPLLFLFGIGLILKFSSDLVRALTAATDAAPRVSWGMSLGAIALGVGLLVGSVGMLRLRRWGWWLMWPLLVVAYAMKPAAMPDGAFGLGWFIYFVCLMSLWSLYLDPQSEIASDIEDIANSLAIDWNATPLPQIEELIQSGRRADAAKLYREHFGCSCDEADLAIRFWRSDTTARKLRYLVKVISEMPPPNGERQLSEPIETHRPTLEG